MATAVVVRRGRVMMGKGSCCWEGRKRKGGKGSERKNKGVERKEVKGSGERSDADGEE